MRSTVAAFLVILGIGAPALASDNNPPAAKPGPLSLYSAADVVRTPADGTAQGPSIRVQDLSQIRTERRPAALSGLYVSLAALNALDVYSTTRALNNGAREVNPVMASTNGNYGAALAIKAATTTSSIYLAEKLWKRNRAAAIGTMLAVNGVTAAIAARNFRNAR
jgi:uncharacterized protein DUF5658